MTEIKVDIQYNKTDQSVAMKLGDYELRFCDFAECTGFIYGLWELCTKLMGYHEYCEEHKN